MQQQFKDCTSRHILNAMIVHQKVQAKNPNKSIAPVKIVLV